MPSAASAGIDMEPSARTSTRSACSARPGRSASGMPSTAEITSMGNGPLMSATRSASPASMTASMRRLTMPRISSSICATRPPVNTLDTSLRMAVCSGGSSSIIICCSLGLSASMGRRDSRAMPPAEEKVLKSRNASSTSSNRLSAQNRSSGFQ